MIGKFLSRILNFCGLKEQNEKYKNNGLALLELHIRYSSLCWLQSHQQGRDSGRSDAGPKRILA